MKFRIFSLLLFVGSQAVAQRVERAFIGQDGLVHVAFRNGSEFIAPREKLDMKNAPVDQNQIQVSVQKPIVAADGRTVAWIANFWFCCTSYPIPLRLLVFRDGRILQRFGERAIFRFVFVKGGAELAYYMDLLHGPSGAQCMLRSVRTGNLLDERHINDGKPLPSWAYPFRAELTPEEKPEP